MFEEKNTLNSRFEFKGSACARLTSSYVYITASGDRKRIDFCACISMMKDIQHLVNECMCTP